MAAARSEDGGRGTPDGSVGGAATPPTRVGTSKPDRLGGSTPRTTSIAVVVRRRAGHAVDASARPFTPLAMAVIRGDARIVNVLLKARADPDAPSFGHVNALSMAVRSCHAGLDVITALIEAGADIENRSGDGITPLMLALMSSCRHAANTP